MLLFLLHEAVDELASPGRDWVMGHSRNGVKREVVECRNDYLYVERDRNILNYKE